MKGWKECPNCAGTGKQHIRPDLGQVIDCLFVPMEPPCPSDRKPHNQRVRDINHLLMEGLTAGVVIDNTPEHRTWYLYEISKYPRLAVIEQCDLSKKMYLIKVRKTAPI
jgi:hypothetical protein